MRKLKESSEIRFFCDLDNTLIYSHRISLDTNKVAVEYLNEKEQSFMTRNTYDFFSQQGTFRLIPVTTRSKPQYERVKVFRESIQCKYALVCNGGVLYVDGVEDEEWYRDSLDMISYDISELKTVREYIECQLSNVLIHDVCGLYFYIKHDTPQILAELLKNIVNPKRISILYDRTKIYCVPTVLNKGTAVDRYVEKFGTAMTIASGDSEFDIPMLARADIRIIPPALKRVFPAGQTIIISDSIFSDGICDCLKTIAKGGNYWHE